MRFSSLTGVTLGLGLLAASHAATVPAGSSLMGNLPDLNLTSLRNTLRILDEQALSKPSSRDHTLQTTQPWPPAPFDWDPPESDGWVLHVNSYDPQRLTFRQMHALLSICVDEMDRLKRQPPWILTPARTVVVTPTQREPFDLSRENIAVAFYNSDDEPGAVWGSVAMVYTLYAIQDMVVSDTPAQLARTVAHYAEAIPKHNGQAYRKVQVQRRTDRGGTATV